MQFRCGSLWFNCHGSVSWFICHGSCHASIVVVCGGSIMVVQSWWFNRGGSWWFNHGGFVVVHSGFPWWFFSKNLQKKVM